MSNSDVSSAPVAIRRGPVRPLPHGFSVFLTHLKMWKNLKQLHFSKSILIESCWGASWELPGTLFPDKSRSKLSFGTLMAKSRRQLSL